MIVLNEATTCQDRANTVWFAVLDRIKKYWLIHLSNALSVLKSICFYSLWPDDKFRYNDVESYNFVIVHIPLRIYLHSITIIIPRFTFKFPLERFFAYIIASILVDTVSVRRYYYEAIYRGHPKEAFPFRSIQCHGTGFVRQTAGNVKSGVKCLRLGMNVYKREFRTKPAKTRERIDDWDGWHGDRRNNDGDSQENWWNKGRGKLGKGWEPKEWTEVIRDDMRARDGMKRGHR